MEWFKENKEDFFIKEEIIAGDECVLIYPNHSISKWTDSNKIYRSSIWRKKDGFPISLGFKKFTNFGEQPSFEPITDQSINDIELIEKMDGTCVIVSKYKGQLIVRTRGSFDAFKQPNGLELEELLRKYKIEALFESWETAAFSLIFEWVSPVNQIILKYEQPDLFLIGMINHIIYSYTTQRELDRFAKTKRLKRPRTFHFNNQSSFEDLAKTIRVLHNQEGVVVYFKGGQLLKKMKTNWYLTLHNLKWNLASFDKVLTNMYDNKFIQINSEWNSAIIIKDYYNYITNNYDYELAEYAKPFIESVVKSIENKIIKPYIFAKSCLIDCKEPEDVLNALNGYPELNKKISWIIFRNKEFNLQTILKLIKQ